MKHFYILLILATNFRVALSQYEVSWTKILDGYKYTSICAGSNDEFFLSAYKFDVEKNDDVGYLITINSDGEIIQEKEILDGKIYDITQLSNKQFFMYSPKYGLIKTDQKGDTLWTKQDFIYGKVDGMSSMQQIQNGGLLVYAYFLKDEMILTFGNSVLDSMGEIETIIQAEVLYLNDGGFIFQNSFTRKITRVDMNNNIIFAKEYNFDCIPLVEDNFNQYLFAGKNKANIGDYNIYLTKFNQYGDSLWSKSIGDTLINVPKRGLLLKNGDFLYSGSSDTDHEYENTCTSVITDSLGNILFIDNIGIYSYSPKAFQTSKGDIISTGILSNQENADKNNSMFIRKYKSKITYIDTTVCDEYISPSGKVWTVSNIYSDTIPGAIEGDSIITVDLTIKEINTVVNTLGNTLTSNETSATYQWLDCNNNYTPIQDAVNNSFTPNISGSYAVKITKDDCIDTSFCKEISITWIMENGFNQEISLYPNPSNGKVTIRFGESQDRIGLRLLDVSGRIISENSYNTSREIYYSINEPDGFYIIEIKNDKNQKAVFKIFKY